MRTNKQRRLNLSWDEYNALKTFCEHPDVVILRADKGNAVVVMDTLDYNCKITIERKHVQSGEERPYHQDNKDNNRFNI